LILGVSIILIFPISSEESQESPSIDGISMPSLPSQEILIHDQDSIQKAIDAAEPEDLLIVDSGVYHEPINITKAISMIGRDTGSGLPVIDGEGDGSAVTLSADGIYLRGFQI
jgi:nitrous oxidase accessory protein NosD